MHYWADGMQAEADVRGFIVRYAQTVRKLGRATLPTRSNCKMRTGYSLV
jgi:hypothetical protein